MKRDAYIYKVLTLDQWANFQASDLFSGSPVDVADGYIHLSCVPELKTTLDKWYADQPTVALLQVEAAAIGTALKYEVSRGGVEFPHLFAALPMSAVGTVWLVSPDADGYRLPTDLKAN